MIDVNIYAVISLLFFVFGIYLTVGHFRDLVPAVMGIVCIFVASGLNFVVFSLQYPRDPSGQIFSLFILGMGVIQVTILTGIFSATGTFRKEPGASSAQEKEK